MNAFKKDNIKIYDMRVGSINIELYKAYCQKKNISMSGQKITKFIIESEILDHPIQGKEDVQKAIDVSKGKYFNSLCEYIEYFMRKELFD